MRTKLFNRKCIMEYGKQRYFDQKIMFMVILFKK